MSIILTIVKVPSQYTKMFTSLYWRAERGECRPKPGTLSVLNVSFFFTHCITATRTR